MTSLPNKLTDGIGKDEAYANLYGVNGAVNRFNFYNIDTHYGYGKIPDKKYDNVLSFGGSWGFELLPYVKHFGNINIVESSEQCISEDLGGIKPKYVKSLASGKLNFEDNSFDLITIFSVLHHIPNVSLVLTELIRVLKPSGMILLREPVQDMNLGVLHQRKGLTKNERGIPDFYLKNIIESAGAKIKRKRYYFFIKSFLSGIIKRPDFFRSRFYITVDSFFSLLFKWNLHYTCKTNCNACRRR